MFLIGITITKNSWNFFKIEKWSNHGKYSFCGESRMYINQEISWHDHCQLGTKHFVPLGRLKIEVGPIDELYLGIIFLTSLSFVNKRTYMLFSFGDTT